MTDNTSTSISSSIVVGAPIDKAFNVFTEDMASWWPPEHHILEGQLAEMVVEPRVGGRLYDVSTDGRECHWGRVLAYEPPTRFVFSWDINLEWKIENDPAKTSEVEIRFSPEGEARTRVDLVHRHLDRHGPGWESMREGVSNPEGWGRGLRRFAERVGALTARSEA